MRNYSMLTLLLIFVATTLNAQNITGRVVDSKTSEVLPFANVFLNNTTMGTVTDTNGEFVLRSIKEPGTYELVVSFVGYESYKTKVVIGEGTLQMNTIKLIPSEIQLSNVEVAGTRDKEWEKNLKKFKKIFLGGDKLASASTILNPWVIDFPQDSKGAKFIAKASAPIEINNEALGYQVVFYLAGFWSDGDGYSITGNARFNELKNNDAKKIEKWQTNRKNAYQHSTHHLFKSIIERRIKGEGFDLYTETDAFKNATSRSSQFYSELGQTVIRYDTAALVIPDVQKDYYRIALKGRVEVHYRKEKARVRVYRDVFGPVSWIRLNKDVVIVNKDGFPKSPADVVVSGDMNSVRVAGMLPLDYKPEPTSVADKINFSMYQEQLYVHTDKPYYYPGETIWYKGYVNYATPAWRDSLSRTAYVELIDRSLKSVVISKTVEINKGVFDNDFRLPDTLTAKMYYLRAYTNFNRNFGDENLFVKPLPVLHLNDKVNQDNAVETLQESPLVIVSDKKVYKPREKITLTLTLKDDEDQPMSSNLSLVVTDSAQVVPLAFPGTIVERFPLKEMENNQLGKDMPFQIEYGINFSGQFLNESNKPEKATLSVLQLNPNNFAMAQSDDEGFFSVNGFSFYDTATFSVQAMRGKDKAYGRGEFVPNKLAAIDFNESEYKIDLSKMESVQRVIPDYEAKGVIVLQEVEIRSTKIEEQFQEGYRAKRPFGKPDYVVKKKDINASYGNLLQTLPGKVPGLIIRQANNDGEGTKWVVYIERGGKNSSILFPKEVIVTVNDVLAFGTPEQILSSIDPATVESVEVKTRVNVLYGLQGGNGIVAVYTKKEFEQMQSTKGMALMKVPGYLRSRKFNSPDYANSGTDTTKIDYRSTIYWNPEMITDMKTGITTVSFFAADLPGKYRIIAEGVAQNGEPVRCVYFVEVVGQ